MRLLDPHKPSAPPCRIAHSRIERCKPTTWETELAAAPAAPTDIATLGGYLPPISGGKGDPVLSNVTMPVTGGCQCGAVRYELTGKPLPLVICHCKECQKQTTSAFGMTLPVLKRDLKLLSGNLKEWRRLADSGREVVCYFCPGCGTRLYHSSSLGPDYWHLKPGTLDDTSWLEPVVQVWTKSAQPWLKLANELASFPGQPDNIAALIRR